MACDRMEMAIGLISDLTKLTEIRQTRPWPADISLCYGRLTVLVKHRKARLDELRSEADNHNNDADECSTIMKRLKLEQQPDEATFQEPIGRILAVFDPLSQRDAN